MTAAILHFCLILKSQIEGYVGGGTLTMLHSDGANAFQMRSLWPGASRMIPLDCDRINDQCICIRDALMD